MNKATWSLIASMSYALMSMKINLYLLQILVYRLDSMYLGAESTFFCCMHAYGAHFLYAPDLSRRAK